MKSIEKPTHPLRIYPIEHFSAPPRLDSGYTLASLVRCVKAARHVGVVWIQALAVVASRFARVDRFPSLVAPTLFLLPACTTNPPGVAK